MFDYNETQKRYSDEFPDSRFPSAEALPDGDRSQWASKLMLQAIDARTPLVQIERKEPSTDGLSWSLANKIPRGWQLFEVD